MKKNKLLIAALCGIVAESSINSMLLDYMGKEEYIAYLSINWIETPWQIWIIPIAASVALYNRLK